MDGQSEKWVCIIGGPVSDVIFHEFSRGYSLRFRGLSFPSDEKRTLPKLTVQEDIFDALVFPKVLVQQYVVEFILWRLSGLGF